MIVAAASLFGVALAVILVTAWHIYSPQGSLGQRKQVYDRIATAGKASELSSLSQSNLKLSDIKLIEGVLKKISFSKTFTMELRRAGWAHSVTTFASLVAIGLLLFFSVASFYFPFLFAVLLTAALGTAPYYVIKRLNQRYFQKFEEHLPDALSMISNAIKVGHGLNAAINVAADNAPYPVSVEFRIVATEISLGLPLSEALNNLYKRSQSPDAKILRTAIGINQELGGNLSELLENLEKTIRGRFSLRREIKAITAQQVASSIFLFLLPFLIIGFFIATKSDMYINFLHSSAGKIVLMICGVLQLLAFFIMKNILKIEE